MEARSAEIIRANESFKRDFGEYEGRHCFQVYKSRDAVCEHCMAARTFEDGKVRVTDEDGFEAVNRLGGLSIRVGDGGETAARYRTDSVEALE